MDSTASAAACEHTSQASAPTHTPTSTPDGFRPGHPSTKPATNDPRGDVRGGRRLSDTADTSELLTSLTSPEYGALPQGRQLALLDNVRVSTVDYGELQRLAMQRVNVLLREEYEIPGADAYDWPAFVADRRQWRLVEEVHRRALEQAGQAGQECQPTDIPHDTVLAAVQDVIDQWTAQPERRPSPADFSDLQRRRGDVGRHTRRVKNSSRDARILQMAAAGMTDAEIAGEVSLSRQQVWRIRKANATPPPALEEEEPVETPADQLPFPASEIPSQERWPVNQFTRQAGVVLDADQARWLAGIGQCCEAEGRIDDLMYAIRMSAEATYDSWGYLQRAILNRGDAWTIPARLLGDVVEWCGETALEFALRNARRPLPYLRTMVAEAREKGPRPTTTPARPVAVAICVATRLAPNVDIIGAQEAADDEASLERTKHVDSYRRRFGRLPWEPDADPPEASEPASDCCIGLQGLPGDELITSELIFLQLESSLHTREGQRNIAATGADAKSRTPPNSGRIRRS